MGVGGLATGPVGGWRTSSIGHTPKKTSTRRGVATTSGPTPWLQKPQGGAGGGGPVQRGGGGRAADLTTRVDPNPYLDKIFGRFEGLFDQSQELYGKAPDPTAALENYKDLRAQGLKEATAQAGQRGFAPGTGMSLAQTQDILSRSQQGEQELTADWANRALDFQKDLLGTMGGVLSGAAGVGAGIGQEQLGYGQLGLDTQRHQLDAWYKGQMLPIEMERARNANLATQIQAISSLAGLF